MVRRSWLAVLGIALGLAPGAAHALPLISEVFYDATGADDGFVFVELYGAPGTDLASYVLEGVNGAGGAVGPSIALSGLIPEDGFFVVADSHSDGSSDVAEADLLLDFDFQNGPDSVVLRQGEALVDAVGYGSFDAGEVFAGEGTPAADPPAGSSLARLFANVDSDDNAADFAPLSLPTPGSGPLAPVPEPGSAVLLAYALAGLACARRRRRRRA